MIDYQPVFTVDNAFKFGCGRFRQEEHLLERCAEEVARVGRSPLLVCTDISAGIALDKIRKSLTDAGIPLRVLRYNGYCDWEAAKQFVALDLQCVRGLKDLLRTTALCLSRSGLGGRDTSL